jgi:hypothetical protein
MSREQTKQTLKLQLLALVLALALVWYSLNPAPRPFTRIKREDELPDEKKREAEPQRMPVALPLVLRQWDEIAQASASSDDEDFEWPEFISG